MSEFNYEGALQALKKWVIANVVGLTPPAWMASSTAWVAAGQPWFAEDTVWIDPPQENELTKYPDLILLTPSAMFNDSSGTVVVVYTIPLGFWVRESNTRAAGQKLRAILQAFDTAWVDQSKKLDTAYGAWALRTQINQPTEPDAAETDQNGAVTHFATKRVQVWERIQARTF